ncbi:hypothetical protein KOR42_25170 [Thalassoglobus neptunius]|uniref:Tetratricopeptide repeat protein n=1 Tax=Thalassoglobus neptunius TaxID=1938619 RepID=A0A5C5X8F9_9PLAN|nr:tetratricopeptide repeat protein [Thalassoglobus neptunius]TWT59128.1 hypothetical protein KOR42_25170 [Thalassoglobus neptunius]
MPIIPTCRPFVAASSLVLLLFSPVLGQEIDTVYLKGEAKPVAGEITAVDKTSVTVNQKIARKDVPVPANTISFIAWSGEPATLNLARSNERAGNLSEAVAGYQEALSAIGSDAPDIKRDVEFFLARTTSKLAQADPEQLTAAIQQLQQFAEQNRNFYRYYDTQILLAETALLANDVSTAEAAYTVLEQSPWLDYQMAAKIGRAKTLLARNDIAAAKQVYDEVASSNPSLPSEKAKQLEAMLGQAECLQRQSAYDQAADILQTVIDQTAADESRVLAEAYLRLGDGYAAQGQKVKEAILAYLHVDVVPSLASHADLHAEALYRLAQLWPVVSQPARGADASAKLEADYPNSPWVEKLGSGG